MTDLHRRRRDTIMAAHEAGVAIYAGSDGGGVSRHGNLSGEVVALADLGLALGAGARGSVVARAGVARPGRPALRGHHGRLRGLRPRPAAGPVSAGGAEADRAAWPRRRLTPDPRVVTAPARCRLRVRRGGGRAAEAEARERERPPGDGGAPGGRGAAGADRSAGRSSAGCGSPWLPGCSSRAGAPRHSSTSPWRSSSTSNGPSSWTSAAAPVPSGWRSPRANRPRSCTPPTSTRLRSRAPGAT